MQERRKTSILQISALQRTIIKNNPKSTTTFCLLLYDIFTFLAQVRIWRTGFSCTFYFSSKFGGTFFLYLLFGVGIQKFTKIHHRLTKKQPITKINIFVYQPLLLYMDYCGINSGEIQKRICLLLSGDAILLVMYFFHRNFYYTTKFQCP